MAPDIRAVCFDMDGVIVDSERHWVPVENECILPRTVPSDAVSASDITGMNVADLYAYLAREYEVALSEAAFIDLYDEAARELYLERVTLMNGFPELLTWLAEQHVARALVSSSPSRWIQLVLDRFEIEDQFEDIVSADDIEGESKPAPDIYRFTATALAVPPHRCLAVEDSHHGVASAVAAGMDCIGYRTDVNDEQDLSRADEVVTGAAELRAVLEARCR